MIRTIILVIFINLLIFSCKKENRWDCVKNTGESIIVSREITPFDSIILLSNVDLYLTQGTEYKLSVEAGKNLEPLITAEVKDGLLTLNNKNTCNWVRSYEPKVKVHLTLPQLLKIQSQGSGNVYSTNKMFLQKTRIENTGVGDITLEVEAGHLFVHTHGFGDVNLYGKAAVVEIYSVGSSFLRFGELKTGYSYIYSNTTGDMFIDAEKELGVRIAGSGDVYYKNEPIIKKVEVSGTGKLLKL